MIYILYDVLGIIINRFNFKFDYKSVYMTFPAERLML